MLLKSLQQRAFSKQFKKV